MNNGVTLFVGNVTMTINQMQYYGLFFTGFDKDNRQVVSKYVHNDLINKSLYTIFDDKDGNIFITGMWGDSLYLSKIDNPTTAQYVSDICNNSIAIFPNPASDYIEINIPPLERGLGGVAEVVRVYNVLGVEVLKVTTP
jgi:hypothetical protein